MNNKIIIISAPTSAGKDFTARELEKNHGYNFVVSTTTRPIRDGESQKNPYNFITNSEFEKLIEENGLIEYREYYTLVDNKPATWFYGVENGEIEDDKPYIVVLDTVGLIEFKRYFGDRVISFYLDVDSEIRKQRCINRGDFNEFEWNRRFEDDKIRFSKEIIEKEIDFVINETEIDKIIGDILKEVK